MNNDDKSVTTWLVYVCKCPWKT